MRQLPDTRDRVSILVADDHPVVRFGLVHLLEGQPDFEVSGEAASCKELCTKVSSLKPDVVVMDLEMGDSTGVEGVARLREHSREARVIVFTAHDEDTLVLEALKLNVQGYVRKSSSSECLCQAIRAVIHGGLYLDPAVAPKVAGSLSGTQGQSASESAAGLTRLELAVLEHMAAGARNKEIAQRLSIGERAVKYHVSAIFAKLRVKNRTQAAESAVRQGLIRWN